MKTDREYDCHLHLDPLKLGPAQVPSRSTDLFSWANTTLQWMSGCSRKRALIRLLRWRSLAAAQTSLPPENATSVRIACYR